MKLFPRRSAAAVLLVALLSSGCGNGDGASSTPDTSGTQPAAPPQQQRAEAAAALLENFEEGPELPADWPADIVVVPEGATPVASLAESTLPGLGQATAVFYSSGQSAEEGADFFERELPQAGWTILDRVDQDGYSEISVQGHDGYFGIFGAGEIPSRPELRSGDVIDVQVVLARLSDAPE